MTPLNWTMNRVADMADSDSLLKKGAIRAITLFGVLPLEVLSSAQNLIKLPFVTGLMACRLPLKVINIFVRSKSLGDVESSLPSFRTFIATALKVIGYAIGTMFTAVLGLFISPKKNFDLHVSLDLISDEKQEAIAAQKKLQAAKKYEAMALELEQNQKNMIAAHRAKIDAKEKELETALRKQQSLMNGGASREPITSAEPVTTLVAATQDGKQRSPSISAAQVNDQVDAAPSVDTPASTGAKDESRAEQKLETIEAKANDSNIAEAERPAEQPEEHKFDTAA